MTILEASYVYGLKEYVASDGDTLKSLVYKIYESYDDICFMILQRLNLRFDWSNVKAGSRIKYITKSALSDIYEITS